MDMGAAETLSMWSHEVRNPIGSMVLSAHALLSRVSTSPELSEIAERIVLAGNRAMTILESAMACGRAIDSKALDLPSQPVAARLCLEQCLQTQSAYADARAVSLVLRLGQGVPDTAQVDARRLRHILDNVVGNAIRFATSRVRISAALSQRGNSLLVVVRDDGPGFEDPRADTLSVRPSGGTGPLATGWGIGLAFAQQIAAAMGGTIRLANAPARAPGACVIVSVPLIRF